MNRRDDWETFWEKSAAEHLSDFEYDHGRSPRSEDIERLSNQELLSFIQPEASDTVFDAGCGTGGNVQLLYSKVRRIVAMDYNRGAVERTWKRVRLDRMNNVEVIQGNVTDIPLPDCSVDKVLCMSVLQYLNDRDVRRAFVEFRRITRAGGMVVLHVKNISSIYLSTLCLMKKAKSIFRSGIKMEYYRSYRWYMEELKLLGFQIVDYNSFNLLMLAGMSKRLIELLRKYELSNYTSWLFRRELIRRHGSDLKIKAQLTRRPADCSIM